MRGSGVSNYRIDAEQVSQRRYKKDLAYIKPNMASYNKQKEQALGLPPGTITDELANPDKSSTVDLYREADSLIYADHKPSEEDLDRLTSKVNDDIQRRKNFSRKRPEKEEDKTYINDRNKVFNNKINRYFNQYTKCVILTPCIPRKLTIYIGRYANPSKEAQLCNLFVICSDDMTFLTFLCYSHVHR